MNSTHPLVSTSLILQASFSPIPTHNTPNPSITQAAEMSPQLLQPKVGWYFQTSFGTPTRTQKARELENRFF